MVWPIKEVNILGSTRQNDNRRIASHPQRGGLHPMMNRVVRKDEHGNHPHPKRPATKRTAVQRSSGGAPRNPELRRLAGYAGSHAAHSRGRQQSAQRLQHPAVEIRGGGIAGDEAEAARCLVRPAKGGRSRGSEWVL